MPHDDAPDHDQDAMTRIEAALERIAQRPAPPVVSSAKPEVAARLDTLITTLRTALDA